MRDRLSAVKWSFIDFLLSLSGCLLIAFFLIAAQKKAEETKETDRSAGNASVFIYWPDQVDTDVDLWLRSPDGDVVSFHHKSGTIWSLLRDDLGSIADITPRNFENAFSRGLPAGEYVANVQLYRNPAGKPIEVGAELRIQRDLNVGSPVTFKAGAIINFVGEEVTLFRFTIDADGNLIPGSAHAQFAPLAKGDK